MTVYISLLRGINVGGNKKIKMSDLQKVYEDLGLQNVKTYIQSGNVLFSSEKSEENLSQAIRTAIQKVFGFDVVIFVLSLAEWRKIVAENPYLQDEKREQEKTYITLISAIPAAERLETIAALGIEGEEYSIRGKVIYLYFENGYGRAQLSNPLWERKLKVDATSRNWNTTKKLLELAEAIGE